MIIIIIIIIVIIIIIIIIIIIVFIDTIKATMFTLVSVHQVYINNNEVYKLSQFWM